MLFEVTSLARPVGITGEEYLGRFISDGMPYLYGLKEQGILLQSWVRVGKNGSVSIFEVDSHQQLLAAVYGNPIAPHVHWEITPIFPSAELNSAALAD